MHEPGPGTPTPKLFRLEDVLRLTGFGFYFGTCILVGAGVGVWLDGRLHTKPRLLMAGLLAGSILGFYGMYVMLKPYLQRSHPGAKKRG